jgi:hypothetical protein
MALVESIFDVCLFTFSFAYFRASGLIFKVIR